MIGQLRYLPSWCLPHLGNDIASTLIVNLRVGVKVVILITNPARMDECMEWNVLDPEFLICVGMNKQWDFNRKGHSAQVT